MQGKTHAAIGVASIVPFMSYNQPESLIVTVPLVLFGALLPDIDADYSLIKSKRYIKLFGLFGLFILALSKHNFQFYSMIILLILIFMLKRTEHRTITHSLLGGTIFATCLFFCFGPLVWAFILGYSTHLIADSLTISGIPLLYPRPNRVGLMKMKTGSISEFFIRAACIAIIIIKIASVL